MSRRSPRPPGPARRRQAPPGHARTEPGTEEPVPIEQLGHGAAELLSLTNGGETRSLNRLAELAAWQVPSCSGAHAAVWRDGEVVSSAATHPDLAELADLQLRSGTGPLLEAAEGGAAVSCPDTLDEARWPDFAEAALRPLLSSPGAGTAARRPGAFPVRSAPAGPRRRVQPDGRHARRVRRRDA